MAVQGVIFDLGHTLMGLDGTWPEIFARGATDLAAYLDGWELGLDGLAFALALIDRRSEMFAVVKQTLREVTAEESVRWTFAHMGQPDPEPALVAGAVDAFFAYEDTCWSACPGALEVLSELVGRGLRLGLFSNATHDPFIQRLVDRLGFRPWLNPALSSAGTGIRKPDPLAFAPILASWRLPPEAVVVVGDTLNADILGAQRAGMRGVWIRSREDARQEGGSARQEGGSARQEGGSARQEGGSARQEGGSARQEGGSAEAGPAIVPDATITDLRELLACLAEM